MAMAQCVRLGRERDGCRLERLLMANNLSGAREEERKKAKKRNDQIYCGCTAGGGRCPGLGAPLVRRPQEAVHGLQSRRKDSRQVNPPKRVTTVGGRAHEATTGFFHVRDAEAIAVAGYP